MSFENNNLERNMASDLDIARCDWRVTADYKETVVEESSKLYEIIDSLCSKVDRLELSNRELCSEVDGLRSELEVYTENIRAVEMLNIKDAEIEELKALLEEYENI